jgi:hypothetical protein
MARRGRTRRLERVAIDNSFGEAEGITDSQGSWAELFPELGKIRQGRRVWEERAGWRDTASQQFAYFLKQGLLFFRVQ